MSEDGLKGQRGLQFGVRVGLDDLDRFGNFLIFL